MAELLASLAVAGMTLAGTEGCCGSRSTGRMAAVPNEVAQDEMQGWLAALRRVVEVHDLHIWSLSTTETALTAHLVYAGETPAGGITGGGITGGETADRRLHNVSRELQTRFGIGHTTLQIETHAEAALCRLRPNHVV